MKRIQSIIFLIVIVVSSLSAQEASMEVEGTITYLSSQNVYIKFFSAKKIKPGDKLFIRKGDNLLSVILVENCSSVSVVGKSTGVEQLKVGDKIIAFVPKEKEPKVQPSQKNNPPKSAVPGDSITGKKLLPTAERKQEVNGRLQFSSYSNFSNLAGGENHRLRYNLLLNVLNVSGSRLSIESYVSFSHKLNDTALFKNFISKGLVIYDLNLKYEFSKNTTVWLGRKNNPKIASLGAVDGIQFEHNFKRFYWGAVAGLRPDYTSEYGFNTKLPEFGAYFGHALENANGLMQTSVAAFEQTNSGNTDRRFAYFQHNNALLKNVNLFVSSEVDFYKTVNGSPVNELSLTSLYASVNYRVTKRISVTSSYDNRKNVIYFETYKSFADTLLKESSLQGVQVRVNYRPINYMNISVGSNFKLFEKDIKQTRNINGALSYGKLPLDITASLSGNYIQTSYVNGTTGGLRLDKSMVSGKLNVGLNYRYVDYRYVSSANTLRQNIGGADLSYQINRKLSFSVNYEGTFEKENKYHSVYFNVNKRF